MKQWLYKATMESRYLPLMILFSIAFTLFSNTFDNSWTYDDFPVIVNNPDLRSLWDFWRNLRGGRPLRELSLLIDYQIFGLDPAGYHIQNIFWHALNAFLVFTCAVRLGSTKFVAWAAALIFLVHPAHVEVVANISNRKDCLALAFMLLSFLAYSEFIGSTKRRIIWLSVSLILAFIAYLAKENALALLLIFMGYELVYLPPNNRFLLRKIWPWLSLFTIAAVAFVGWFFWGGGREIFLQESHDRLLRMNYFLESTEFDYFRMVLKSWIFMFQKLILPVKLAPDYIYEIPKSWFDPWVVSALVGLAFYGASLGYAFYRSKLAFFALVWLGAFWLPTSSLFPLSALKYFAADRFLYVPSVGFFVAVAMLLERIVRYPKIRIGIILLFVLALSNLTWKQNEVWQSSISLWTHTVKISPQSIHVLNNLGTEHLKKGEYEQALALFSKAVKVNPNHAISQYHLGLVYEKRGEVLEAIKHYRTFIEIAPPINHLRAMILKQRLEYEYGISL